MQQSTNAVVLEIENAVQNDTYYVMSEHELAMEERLLLDENQVKYEEYHWNQIFYEQNFYETMSDKIYYLLPNWDLTKQ